VWAAGAVVSTGDDVRRFYRALLGGRLLKPAQLAEMRDVVPTDDGYDYGLGLYRTPTPCGQMWGHGGNLTGHATIAWSDETGRRGITVGLPTQPDQRIGEAFVALVTVAACRALGQDPPPA
jgi:D-alanyl-D-alanine carboxypeptidase